MSASSVEEHLGLTGWSADGGGIGGLLKVRIEDFRVEEVASVPEILYPDLEQATDSASVSGPTSKP